MSLYDRENPSHLRHLDSWSKRSARYTLSRRGQPGFCEGCGWTRAAADPCRNNDCPTNEKD